MENNYSKTRKLYEEAIKEGVQSPYRDVEQAISAYKNGDRSAHVFFEELLQAYRLSIEYTAYYDTRNIYGSTMDSFCQKYLGNYKGCCFLGEDGRTTYNFKNFFEYAKERFREYELIHEMNPGDRTKYRDYMEFSERQIQECFKEAYLNKMKEASFTGTKQELNSTVAKISTIRGQGEPEIEDVVPTSKKGIFGALGRILGSKPQGNLYDILSKKGLYLFGLTREEFDNPDNARYPRSATENKQAIIDCYNLANKFSGNSDCIAILKHGCTATDLRKYFGSQGKNSFGMEEFYNYFSREMYEEYKGALKNGAVTDLETYISLPLVAKRACAEAQINRYMQNLSYDALLELDDLKPAPGTKNSQRQDSATVFRQQYSIANYTPTNLENEATIWEEDDEKYEHVKPKETEETTEYDERVWDED